jgi:hypothetical protein
MRPDRATVAALLAIVMWPASLVANPPAEAPPVTATQTPIEHASGPIALPTTGLRIELPALPDGATYRISGRWGINADGHSWSRDVIDEVRDGRLIGATWYFVGPFASGDCDAVVETVRFGEVWREARIFRDQRVAATGGTFEFKGDLGIRPAIAMCGGPKARPWLVYRFVFEPGDPQRLERDRLVELARASQAVAAIIEAHHEGRWTRVRPRQDPSVMLAPESQPIPTSVDLVHFGARMPLPDDGALWVHSNYDLLDWFDRRVPRLPPLAVGFGRVTPGVTCADEAAIMRQHALADGESLLPTVAGPKGWQPMLTIRTQAGRAETVLCRHAGGTWVIALVRHEPNLGDVVEVEPLFEAFVGAVGTSTPPDDEPAPPEPERVSAYPNDVGWFSLDLALALSWRDMDNLGRSPDAFPATRVAGPGIGFESMFVEPEGGPLVRWAMGAAPDIAALFDSDLESTARFGGQVFWGHFDLGFGGRVADRHYIGGAMGWHGVAGPLLLNSSASLSLLWVLIPESTHDFGMMARLTPLQLLASNERWALSPLSLDIRAAFDGLTFGLELQWVAPPQPGDEDIPATGWAAILRVGFGGFIF